MTATVMKTPNAPQRHKGKAHDHEHHDPTPTTLTGFWIYLMSDCILFAALFATYEVLHHNTAGGPAGKALFELPYVAIETGLLLVSSVTYGFAMLGLDKERKTQVLGWLGVTFLLGLCFIGMEVNEFSHLIAKGAGPDRSAFLSAFFTLVGTHGIHVTTGLIWMAVLTTQILSKGLTASNRRRLMCLSLFWHFLDIIWIGVFTIVYLMGAM